MIRNQLIAGCERTMSTRWSHSAVRWINLISFTIGPLTLIAYGKFPFRCLWIAQKCSIEQWLISGGGGVINIEYFNCVPTCSSDAELQRWMWRLRATAVTVWLVRVTLTNVVTARCGAAAGVAAQVSQSLYWTPYCSLGLYIIHRATVS